MATITQLIRSGKQKPIRRVYIKRKLASDGSYETEWQNITKKNGQSTVVKWGTVSVKIDDEQGRIGAFNLSNLTMTFNNKEGLFNSENDPRSIWAEDGGIYLNRKYTKVKIEAGYYDEDGETEVGVATIFEGVIDYVSTSDNQTAKMRVLPYTSILKGYDISDLSMTGKKSVNTIIDLIMNQTKITEFIPYVASDANENVDITDTSAITGTYWDVITDLAFKSNSVPILDGATWAFKARNVGASSAFDFIGKGERGTSDILKIKSYDDGDTKVKLHWIVSGTNIEAISTDPLLLKKYLSEPEEIDLSDVDTNAQKQDIVDSLLAEWETPKQVLEFETRFFINQLTPLDKITISIKGQTVPSNTFIWGAWKWGNGSVWGKKIGAILISGDTNFMIIKVSKNLDSWTNTIKCEQQNT